MYGISLLWWWEWRKWQRWLYGCRSGIYLSNQLVHVPSQLPHHLSDQVHHLLQYSLITLPSTLPPSTLPHLKYNHPEPSNPTHICLHLHIACWIWSPPPSPPSPPSPLSPPNPAKPPRPPSPLSPPIPPRPTPPRPPQDDERADWRIRLSCISLSPAFWMAWRTSLSYPTLSPLQPLSPPSPPRPPTPPRPPRPPSPPNPELSPLKPRSPNCLPCLKNIVSINSFSLTWLPLCHSLVSWSGASHPLAGPGPLPRSQPCFFCRWHLITFQKEPQNLTWSNEVRGRPASRWSGRSGGRLSSPETVWGWYLKICAFIYASLMGRGAYQGKGEE